MNILDRFSMHISIVGVWAQVYGRQVGCRTQRWKARLREWQESGLSDVLLRRTGLPLGCCQSCNLARNNTVFISSRLKSQI